MYLQEVTAPIIPPSLDPATGSSIAILQRIADLPGLEDGARSAKPATLGQLHRALGTMTNMDMMELQLGIVGPNIHVLLRRQLTH